MVEVARTVAELRADVQNCIPLLPVPGTAFSERAQPAPALLGRVRGAARQHLPQMAYCSRCRADACGLLARLRDRNLVAD